MIRTIIEVILKIIFFPVWVWITIIGYIVWGMILDDRKAWKEVFIDKYFSLD